MTVRTEPEIRAEMDRWTNEVRRLRTMGDRRSIEAFAAHIIADALAWTLGLSASPTHRIKIKDRG